MRSVDGRSVVFGLIAAVCFSGRLVHAAEPPIGWPMGPLTVVEQRAGSVSTKPYLQTLSRTEKQILVPKNVPYSPRLSRSTAEFLRHNLPITPSKLRLATPSVKRIEGLAVPVFVMGLDRASLEWFERSAANLAKLGAQGVVVQATRQDQWQAFKEEARAKGITVRLIRDSAIVEGYGVSTYPIVLADPSVIDGPSRMVSR